MAMAAPESTPIMSDTPTSNGAAGVLHLAARLEAILFVADGPVAMADLAKILGVGRRRVEAAVAELEHRRAGSGVRVQRSGRRVQMVTAPQAADAVAGYLGLEASSPLSKPALETLAIVAYQQPVTKPEIEALRGVNCDAVVRTLIGRGLVAEAGRRDTVGLPIEYATTFRFLEYFGLASLDSLPPVGEFVAAARPTVDGSVDGAEDDA